MFFETCVYLPRSWVGELLIVSRDWSSKILLYIQLQNIFFTRICIFSGRGWYSYHDPSEKHPVLRVPAKEIRKDYPYPARSNDMNFTQCRAQVRNIEIYPLLKLNVMNRQTCFVPALNRKSEHVWQTVPIYQFWGYPSAQNHSLQH